ncbi:MAG: tetratricopeptide repeat protein [Chitinophagaceae bacterium]|nr:MAG: tetratricopeptide repeat protein [Chitinophagaceae bacterium]
MSRFFIVLLYWCLVLPLSAQQPLGEREFQDKYLQAKTYFQKDQLSLAYPLFQELQQEISSETGSLLIQDIKYYNIVCGLKKNEQKAKSDALDFINLEKNNPRVHQVSFHLAEYNYREQNFSEAAQGYAACNIAHLSNEEIGDLKFHQGYSYFILQRFSEAIQLFNSIRQLGVGKYYTAANYYYGFLSFKNGNWTEALESFKIVESEREYDTIVPYYIAQIYYTQNRKQEAIRYAENIIRKMPLQYYDLELKQLIGQGHFELFQYSQAVPYLEEVYNRSTIVTRENLYELSYTYYQTEQLQKAIEGFKQLGGKIDSLSQHAMYLLGDAYLKVGEKAKGRNAFLFCASNSSNPTQKEISTFNYAKLSFELGFEDEALNSLNDFLLKYPTSNYAAEAKEYLVAVLANTNNYSEALQLIENMTTVSAQLKKIYPKILYGRATELINDNELMEANLLLDKALKNFPSQPLLAFINFWKGEIAYRNNQWDEAIQFLTNYLTANSPNNGEANVVAARYNLGYCYLRKENYAVALQYFESIGKSLVTAASNMDYDISLRIADCYFMNRDYAKAKAIYEKLISFSRSSEDYARYQNALIAGIKNPTVKIDLLNTLILKFPNSNLVAEANLEIANTFLADEKFRDAIPYLNEVLKVDSKNNLKPLALLKLGIVYYNLNKSQESLFQYKELLQNFPHSFEAEDALENIKAIYIEKGETEAYATYMRQIGKPLGESTEDSLTWIAVQILYDNESPNVLSALNNYLLRFSKGQYAIAAHFFMGEIYYERKDWENALKGYEEVAEMAPNNYAEKAILQAARIYFFELKDYEASEVYYDELKLVSNSQEIKLEAMRGMLRSQYQQKKWTEAFNNAQELIALNGSSTDDRALSKMVIAKAFQQKNQVDSAIINYKTVIALNKASLAAEARYEIALSWFVLNKYPEAEKAAFEVINKSGSYEFWVTKTYILLGDVYYKQKDYFNAKATYQSVVENSALLDLKKEAKDKLDLVLLEEKKISKIVE